MKKRLRILALILCLCMLCACGTNGEYDGTSASGSSVTADAGSATGSVVTGAATETKKPAPGFHAPEDESERYHHGTDGYFCLDDAGIHVDMIAQKSGTCWIHAGTCSMKTAYQIAHDGKEIELDPMELVPKIYRMEGKEGYSLDGANIYSFGGQSISIINTLANGFDGLVVDRGIDAAGYSPEQFKEAIQKYGACVIGVPDSDPTKKSTQHGYTTLRHVTKNINDYDHSVALIGWDDHFPKEYFCDTATQDGAWITYNSQSNSDYYYISYDVRFDNIGDVPAFISVTDEYKDVLYHDQGFHDKLIKTGDETVAANIFHKKGTLAAVGTYTTKEDEEIEIEIRDKNLKKVLYRQKATPFKGYSVVKLDQPVEVDDFAVVIHYPTGAPVEGPNWKYEEIRFKTVIHPGESYVKIGDKWMDLSKKETKKKLDIQFTPRNACIKALMV